VNRRQGLWLVALVVVGLAMAAVLSLAGRPSDPLASIGLAAAERRLAERTAASTEFGSARLRKALRAAGALHLAVPADPLAAVPPDATGRCPEPHFTDVWTPPEALPSSRLAPAELVARGLPTVSLVVEPCRLARLTTNPSGGGRRFEEPGWVSFFDRGALVWASAVGVRLHGGGSRTGEQDKSFRLYARAELGAAELPGSLLGEDRGALDRVILHNDHRLDRDGRRWHFLNPLAYRLGEQLGALVPRTRPLWMVLNGEPVHVYVATEHIAADYFARRFGDRPIHFVRGKGQRDPDDEARYQAARQAAVDLPAPLTMAAAGRLFDVPSLTRLYATIQLAATGDMFQSAMAREEPPEGPAGPWFLVHWDFDMSFRVPERNPQHGWEKDLFRFVQKGPAGLNIPPRIVLWRLLAEDPEYRAEVARVLAGAMNHEVGPQWWAETLAGLRADVERFGIADRAFLYELARFAEERPRVLREQIPQWLGTGPAHRIELASASAVRRQLVVDGRRVTLPWQGWVFGGQRLELRAADGEALVCRGDETGTAGAPAAPLVVGAGGGVEVTVTGPLSLLCAAD
jgi:hypothetical protein